MDAPYLIVGLGNPGTKYEGTRHNVGFDLLRLFAQKKGLPLNHDRKARADFAKGTQGKKQLILLLPMTYMNLSGDSVADVARFYKVPVERVLVVYDDADMPLGRLRVRSEGGSGGHNGIKSLIERLGSGRFSRLRVGIGRDAGRDLADFVLERFKSEEGPKVEEALELGCKLIDVWLDKGPDEAAKSLEKLLKEKTNGRDTENAPLRGDVCSERDPQ